MAPKAKSRMIGVRVDQKLYDQVQECSKLLGISMGSLIAQLIEPALPAMVAMQRAARDVGRGEIAKAFDRLDKEAANLRRDLKDHFESKRKGS